ncbi:MAG: AbrB/MazE/SpoVT family DNA-binding domain-containing protein [Deferrisomatales bacterium]|nr:AbrB/MazE/SpoVT family DNA-binding domain-containing protein [Deferrisomatales bacterium]
MKITSKGQVTIPQEIRERFGLLPGTEVAFVPDGAALRVVKQKDPPGRGKKIVQRLLGRATVRMTTDEILDLTRGE